MATEEDLLKILRRRMAADLVIDQAKHAVYFQGEELLLTERQRSVLVALASKPGELQTNDELDAAVWKGTIVEPGQLYTHISALRKILAHALIRTQPKHGYTLALRPDQVITLDT